ncbi:aminotransferase [Opitutaceae bacterium TAV5]|nr:aminotransferase [Opitutaceae bacterium TAV5]
MSYFDHNATTPLSPAARAAWLKMADEAWHNPSSLYRAAARARIRLDSAREALAALLGGEPAHYVFTSGATEGAHAVLGRLAATLPADSRLAINPTEHPCVIAAAQRFFGDRILPLPVTADGVVTAAAIETVLADPSVKTGAVVVMAANNETGVIQPWREIARACRAAAGGAGVPFVCDVTQWLGKLPGGGLGEAETGATLIASAHKFGGPKGVGFVKLPADDPGFRLQPGGSQEHDHRGGTEDLPSIAALVAALADAEQQKVFLESDRLRIRDTAERALLAAVPGARIVGAGADRLWNTVSLLLPFGENTRWVTRLDKRDAQVSTGSACATGKTGPSHVLTALGLSPDEARRSLRISSGWETTESDWQALAAALAEVAAELRQP